MYMYIPKIMSSDCDTRLTDGAGGIICNFADFASALERTVKTRSGFERYDYEI